MEGHRLVRNGAKIKSVQENGRFVTELPIHTGHADAKSSLEEVSAVSRAEIHFGFDGQANRENDFLLAGRKRDCTLEAGRPGGRKELLRSGTDPIRAGSC
jgi:hypothetical protein